MRICDALVLISDDPIARKDVPEMAEAQGWLCEVSQGDVGTRFLLSRVRSD